MLRPLARSIQWLPLAIAILISTAIVAWPSRHVGTPALQVIAIMLSGAAGFAFDDPASAILAASPTSLLRRRLARLTLILPPVGVLWGVLVWLVGTEGPDETWALMALLAGMIGLSIGISAVACQRSPRGLGGFAVAPSIFILLFASTVISPRWRPLPLGDVPGGWTQIYLRWSAAAVIGAIMFLAASRDPAR